MVFYVTPPSSFTDLKQGDLLANVPFSYFNLTQATVIGANGQPAERDFSRIAQEAAFVVASVEHTWGIILTHTCDLQPWKGGQYEDPVLIARVRPVA